jgi:hypothetical protein
MRSWRLVLEVANMARVLNRAERADVAAPYASLHLEVEDDHRSRIASVSISPAPHGFKDGVRGGT